MEARFGYDGRKIVQGGAGADRIKGLEGIPGGEMEEGSSMMWVMVDLQGTRASGLRVLCEVYVWGSEAVVVLRFFSEPRGVLPHLSQRGRFAEPHIYRKMQAYSVCFTPNHRQ